MDKWNLVDCAVWLVLSGVALTASLRLGIGAFRSPGPGFIPFWAGIGLAFFACILLGLNLAAKTKAMPRDNGARAANRRNRLIVVIAALTLYCLTLAKLGYLLATFGLMIVLFRLGKMRPWAMVIGALIASLSSYGLFAFLLGTPLPRGFFRF
jgi:hypothetical protein